MWLDLAHETHIRKKEMGPHSGNQNSKRLMCDFVSH